MFSGLTRRRVTLFLLCISLLTLPVNSAFLTAVAQTLQRPYRATMEAGTPSDDWPTYHRNTFRSGYDPTFSLFTSVSLHWKSTTLDGDVYAEPLIVGTAVIAATENNSVYELNATTGQTIWHTNLGTPVNGGVLPCGNINPSGITSTPAIDVFGRTIFVVAFLSTPSLHHELYGINLDNGNIRFQLAIDPSGANPTVQQQRGALALANGYVYIPYGGLDGDCGSYHGWIAATSANGGGPVLSYQVPTGNAGAIWGGGDGPAIDSSGDLLVSTGNSFSSSTFDYGDAVLKLSPATTPPISLVDWFAPSNWAQLNDQDLDLGSTEPVILSSNYLFQIGKQGVGYVLNATNLGHIGGQLYSSQVCTSGHSAYGGLAYSSPYLVVPCDNGLVVLNVNLGANPPFTVLWRGPNYLAGPPIIAGNAVWDVDVSSGLLYAFTLNNGQTIFQATIGSLPTHFNSLSAADGQIFVTANRQVLAYQTTVTTTTTTTSVSTSTVGEICSSTSTTSMTSTIIAALISTSTSQTVSTTTTNVCTQTVTSTTTSVRSTTFTRPSSSISLTAPGSVLLGSSATLAGSISPNPGSVQVTLSLSSDGITYTPFITTITDATGSYSVSWIPPYPGSYSLEASWNGNNQFAGSTSTPTSITVTGSVTSSPTILLSAPSTASHGQIVEFSIRVFNPTSTGLTTLVAIQIQGPNNYVLFETVQTNAPSNSYSTVYYEWTVPNQFGTYSVSVGLLPNEPGAIDTATIQVT